MARRKPKKRPVNRSIPTPTPRTLDVRHRLPPVELAKRDVLKPDLKPVEDLRHVSKEPSLQREPFRTVSGRVARTERRPARNPQGTVQKSWLSLPLHDYFRSPRQVLVCIRRDTRARVLFALQKIGRGRKVSRIHRFTEKSRVRCK